eukprot:gene3637-4529_t
MDNNKSLALNLLTIYSIQLKEHLYPYLENVLQLSSQLLDYESSVDVRIKSSILLPFLFRVYWCHFNFVLKSPEPFQNHKYGQNLLQSILKSLLTSLNEKETQPKVIKSKIVAIGECLEFVEELEEKEIFIKESFETIKIVFNTLKKQEMSFKRYNTIRDRKNSIFPIPGTILEFNTLSSKDDEYENSSYKILDETFNHLSNFICDLIIMFKSKVFPMVVDILPLVVYHLDNSLENIPTSMSTIIRLFIQHCGESVLTLYPQFIPSIVKSCWMENPTIRQSSSFCLAVAVQKSPDHFSPFISTSVEALLHILSDLIESKATIKVHCHPSTAYATYALGRILNNLPFIYQYLLSETLPKWLSLLPIQEDDIVTPVCETLIDLVLKYQNQLVGSNFQKLSKILDILGGAVTKKQINAAYKKKLESFLSTCIQPLEQGLPLTDFD